MVEFIKRWSKLSKTIIIALVKGDGSGPEMMDQAARIAIEAAKLDSINIEFVETPMGWNAYEKNKDTLPQESFNKAYELGIVFFGGVGDFKFDSTIGVEHPEMRPESRVLLALRKKLGLLINIRPIRYYKSLSHLANVKDSVIPDNGVTQVWIRFLLEDSYFGNDDLLKDIPEQVAKKIGIKLKKDITGKEEIVTDLAYYKKSTIEKYLRYAFKQAQDLNLPLISIDKANVLPRYDYWHKITAEIAQNEFPKVAMSHQLVDSANSMLFTPAKLNGVIACGNEHGDILSDGAAAAVGSMGMMCSSSINPDTNAAFFESGAGTAPTIAGQNKANPLGRILTAALMLRHIGAKKGAVAIENAVNSVLRDGYKTGDLMAANDDKNKLCGTKEMGQKVIERL